MEDLDAFIASYKPNDRAVEIVRSLKIALLVGISGAGKDTIKNRLLQTNNYHNIVTHTSRLPRLNRGKPEQDGINYHFVSKDAMVAMLRRHELIEANKYSDNIYGTSVSEFERTRDAGKIAIADIDVNGVASFEQIAPGAVRAIFLTPPSYEVWFERWRNRYGNDYVNHLDELASRKRTAIAELRHVLKTPYYFFVVNDELDRAVQDVDAIAKTGGQDEADRQQGRAVVADVLRAMEEDL